MTNHTGSRCTPTYYNGNKGPFWAHPVISKGKLYIRHGDVLMVYLIK